MHDQLPDRRADVSRAGPRSGSWGWHHGAGVGGAARGDPPVRRRATEVPRVERRLRRAADLPAGRCHLPGGGICLNGVRDRQRTGGSVGGGPRGRCRGRLRAAGARPQRHRLGAGIAAAPRSAHRDRPPGAAVNRGWADARAPRRPVGRRDDPRRHPLRGDVVLEPLSPLGDGGGPRADRAPRDQPQRSPCPPAHRRLAPRPRPGLPEPLDGPGAAAADDVRRPDGGGPRPVRRVPPRPGRAPPRRQGAADLPSGRSGDRFFQSPPRLREGQPAGRRPGAGRRLPRQRPDVRRDRPPRRDGGDR